MESFCSQPSNLRFKRAYVRLRSGKFHETAGITHQTAIGRTVPEYDDGRTDNSVG